MQYFVKSNGQTDQIARGSYGTLTISSATGQYLYVLNNADPAVQALGRNDSMTETFTVVVRDEHGKATETQLTVTINGANDAPVITSAPGLTVTEDTVLTSSASSYSLMWALKTRNRRCSQQARTEPRNCVRRVGPFS